MNMQHEPTIRFTAKEINILVQMLELAREDESVYAYARKAEVEALREKLQGRGK